MDQLLTIWWEGASIHYALTTLPLPRAYGTARAEYWGRGQAGGHGGEGDTIYRLGRPTAPAATLGEWGLLHAERSAPRERAHWAAWQEARYRELLAELGEAGPERGPAILLTVLGGGCDFGPAWVSPGVLWEACQEEAETAAD